MCCRLIRLDINWCLTNFVPCAPTRGAGRPQGMYVMERLLDAVAREARARTRRNALPQHDPAVADAVYDPDRQRDGSTMVYDSGDYPECQRRALGRGGWADSRCAGGGTESRAAISGSASPIMSRPPGAGRSKARPSHRRVRQDRRDHRRDRAGPGHQVDAGAARGGRARCAAPERIEVIAGDTAAHRAGLRRLRQPPGGDCRQRACIGPRSPCVTRRSRPRPK